MKNVRKVNFESMHCMDHNRNKISKNEVDNLVIYCLNNECTYCSIKLIKIEGMMRF